MEELIILKIILKKKTKTNKKKKLVVQWSYFLRGLLFVSGNPAQGYAWQWLSC